MREALDMLGFGPCHHMRALIDDPGLKAKWRQRAAHGTPDWPDIFDGFTSTIDWPSAHYWPDLISAYPDSKVILTWRTAESWWACVPSISQMAAAWSARNAAPSSVAS